MSDWGLILSGVPQCLATLPPVLSEEEKMQYEALLRYEVSHKDLLLSNETLA